MQSDDVIENRESEVGAHPRRFLELLIDWENRHLQCALPESGKPAAFTELKEHEGEQRSTGAKERAFETASSPLFALAFDRESLWTYAGGEDGKLRVWDDKGKLVQTLEAPGPGQTNPTPNPVASTNE
jgi:hypothetical protein